MMFWVLLVAVVVLGFLGVRLITDEISIVLSVIVLVAALAVSLLMVREALTRHVECNEAQTSCRVVKGSP